MSLGISSAQTFSFSDGKVTTFPKSWKCKNFNFSLYAVREEMPYPHGYLTNFQKLFFCWKKRKLVMWLKISSAQTFSFCYSNVTTFPTSWKCKNFNYCLYTVPAEMIYLLKYLTNFQKPFFLWKKWKVAIVVENFKCTDIFVFEWQRYNFPNIPKM